MRVSTIVSVGIGVLIPSIFIITGFAAQALNRTSANIGASIRRQSGLADRMVWVP